MLLEAMVRAGVSRLVFSSTAAVYGEPEQTPIGEDAPLRPCNSYGESKLAFETRLPWYQKAYGLRYVSLRYFNACGAAQRRGECRSRETHLIPIALAAALGQRERLDLFGNDYDTPDGTCVRDYVHVADIAGAHLLVLQSLDRVHSTAYNLGNGDGYSNLQVIDAVREVTGRKFAVRPADRRPGDPARLVADSGRIRRDLGWQPAFPSCAKWSKARGPGRRYGHDRLAHTVAGQLHRGGDRSARILSAGARDVISTAINKYIYITVNKKFDNRIRASYSVTEIVENSVDQVRHELIREGLRLIGR